MAVVGKGEKKTFLEFTGSGAVPSPGGGSRMGREEKGGKKSRMMIRNHK